MVLKRQQRVDELMGALTLYLAAVREGELDAEAINGVLGALDRVPSFGLRRDSFSPLVREVALITQRLAEANRYELPEASTPGSKTGSLVELRSSLNHQLQIIRQAA